MTLAQVIALINSEIIPNNNNEITANVLRPILLEMLQQPNDLIGDLSTLTTADNSNIVNAINELKNDLTQINGINIFQGVGDPNINPLSGAVIADFYSELDVSSSVVGLWVYNGVEWIRLTDSYVSYDFPQSLSSSQQQQALDNINALNQTPNGTDDLIGTNNKINDVYLPDSDKVDKSTTITINGVTQDLSVNRTWTIPSAVNDVEWIVLTGGGQVSPNAQKTVVHIQPNDVVDLDDGIFEGQEVAVVVCGGMDYEVNGSVVDACGNQNTLTFSSGGNMFWWSENDVLWIQAT